MKQAQEFTSRPGGQKFADSWTQQGCWLKSRSLAEVVVMLVNCVEQNIPQCQLSSAGLKLTLMCLYCLEHQR